MITRVIEKRFRDANPMAKLNRQILTDAGVYSVSISGGPGCGKTALIEASIKGLGNKADVGVIACDVSSHLDADRLVHRSDQIVQVTTEQQGAADANHIRDAFQWLNLPQIDLLLIENIGGLPLDVGQHASAVIFSIAAGHDKADKRPDLVKSADVVVLNKTDLIEAVPFDLARFRADVRRLNPKAEVMEISALRGDGLERWLQWLGTRVKGQHSRVSNWFG